MDRDFFMVGKCHYDIYLFCTFENQWLWIHTSAFTGRDKSIVFQCNVLELKILSSKKNKKINYCILIFHLLLHYYHIQTHSGMFKMGHYYGINRWKKIYIYISNKMWPWKQNIRVSFSSICFSPEITCKLNK